MAQRGKRINRNDNETASCPGAIKRRKCRVGPAAMDTPVPAAVLGPSEEEETMASSSQGGLSWTPRPLSDIKISSIYNRSAAEPPAELYRKDLISAMKLPDSEPLSPGEYWIISDQWKQEWEKGVQVPVNPDSLPEPTVTLIQTPPMNKLYGEFKLPKKFLRITRDDCFNSEDHYLSTTPSRAEKACGYDLDDTDIAWLEVLNGERALCGHSSVTESQLERVIEELEHRCWDKIQTIVKNEEGLGIEYDENVICDVCRSPDSEEGNEMVFCDFCNICVHQACYGITSIPDGSWLCRTCSLGQRPECVLCPNPGGAMKSTRSGQKWAHVSCALWIPEVSIGCVERMEPITKISSIPQSRWALICVLCRERVGACIQCSIKTCKTAYHVTCAFKHGLEMKAIIEDEQAEDGVKLRSYCQKHGKINTKDKTSGGGIGSESGKGGSDSEEGEVRRRKRKDMSSEEKNQARAAKLQEIEAEFDKHVSLKDITNQQLDVDSDAVIYIYNYWKLKRRSGHNKPLLPPRCGELSGSGVRAQGQAADNEKMRKFVQLRQDLERVRNLCYMVNRREKLCRTFLRLREQTFHKQALLISGITLPTTTAVAIMEANHGPSIYDHLYSHQEAEMHSHDIDSLLSRIKGIDLPKTLLSSNEKKHQPNFNGASNKRLHFNGSVSRKKLYSSDISSMSSSETEQLKPVKDSTGSKIDTDKKLQQFNKSKSISKIETGSSTEDDDKQSFVINKASSSNISPRRKFKKESASDRSRTSTSKIPDESSESDIKPQTATTRSRTLHHMERELGSASGSDSDELITISNKSTVSKLGPTSVAEIYSDTDDSSLERSSCTSSYIVSKVTTKSFSSNEMYKRKDKDKYKNKDNKDNIKSKELLVTTDKKDVNPKNKENLKTFNKKKECIASALIVPQRQAAKKASEIMQRSQNKKETISTITSTSIMVPAVVNETVSDIKSLVEDIKPIIKLSKDFKEIKESKLSTTLCSSSRKHKQENKVSLKEVTKDSKGNDIYEFEFGDNSEIFAYVPQRQAAKKAAEHIKSGTCAKSLSISVETDIFDGKLKKETADISASIRKKQEIKKEESPTKEEIFNISKKSMKKAPIKILSESSSSSSSSSSCSSSTDTSSDTDDIKSPEIPEHHTTIEETALSSTSSDSDSEQHSSNRSKAYITIKSRLNQIKTESKTETKNESKSECKIESKVNAKAESKVVEEEDTKSISFSSSSGTGRKLKKLPDKKLKTSDGRYGHEFQPPSTERDESSRTSSICYKNEYKNNDHKEQYQQFSSKYKSTEYKDSCAKKSATIQPQQQYCHQQQHQSQAEINESMLSGSRDNDGSRNLFGLKSPKKISQITKKSQQYQQQQHESSFIKTKKDFSFVSKGKGTEARKRKSSQVPQKEEKSSSKDATSIKKMEKELIERLNEKSSVMYNLEREITCTNERVATVEPIQKISTQAENIMVKNDNNGKKLKKNNNKNNIITLEEEMKQRRAERDSPKKSSRGLDKLLEKREHLDKLSRSKNIETSKHEKSQSIEKVNKIENFKTENASKLCKQLKNENSKTYLTETNNASVKVMSVKDFSSKRSNEITPKKDLFDSPISERLNSRNKNIRDTKNDVPISSSEYITSSKMTHKYQKDDTNKNNSEILFSKPLLEKIDSVIEISEKENNTKQRRSINRSIFSPQHGSKDTNEPELFDFDQDILTDDMVNDDGFTIPRDAEERAAPLSFSFNNELWFKEDTKEDSARETLHLVEKLRMELSKKSNSNQLDLEPSTAIASAAVTVDTEMRGHCIRDIKLKNQGQHRQILQLEEHNTKEIDLIDSEVKTSNVMASLGVEGIVQTENQQIENKKSFYTNDSQSTYLSFSSDGIESGKVTLAERAKLDRAEADERWVPPSNDSFNTADQLNSLIDSQAQRYGLSEQQFPNDLSATVLSTESTNVGNLIHSQLQIDIQEQQYMLRTTIESHGEGVRTIQGLTSIVEHQVSSLPSHIVEEVTPIEMVSRHLISLPGTDDDQTSEIDRTLDKDEIGSEITRQEYTTGGSPYNDLNVVRQDTRWAESQVLPSRRSTSSSITSASSADDHTGIPPYKTSGNSSIQTVSFPVCSVEVSVGSYHSYESTNTIAGPISLFPSQSNNTQLPYPSPNTAIFPPTFGTSFSTPQTIMPHVSKPLEEQISLQASPCTAAFTSSSHNMAFTAAMVSPSKLPSSPHIQSILDETESEHERITELYEHRQCEDHQEHEQKNQKLEQIEEISTATVVKAILNKVEHGTLEQPSEILENEQIQINPKSLSSHVGKKSPTKPTRTSARVTSLQGKSPGKSPRQQDSAKVSSTNRARGRGSKSSQQSGRRGRGRGRGRGKASQHNNALYGDDSIQNKLIGSVYDFDSDEDSPGETNIADLRTMRERKKSIELSAVLGNERRENFTTLSIDTISIQLSSSGEQLRRCIVADSCSAPGDDSTVDAESESGGGCSFNDPVLPLLPGPVDMRTYNLSIEEQDSTLHDQSYTNHLLDSLSSVTVEHALPDTEEDLEKELHSALTIKQHLQQPEHTTRGTPALEVVAAALVCNPSKIELTDSRNQLKVKIKGPFLDANYTTSSTVPLPLTQQIKPIAPPQTTNTAAIGSGTSNLRRMRKKELLRQYCSQDMNMDDPSTGSVPSVPIVIPPINRTVITIPKAVASMTSIPTREDYKAVVDANMEKKRRKERANVGSLGGLLEELPGADEEHQFGSSERRRSSSGPLSGTERRRGRQPRPSTQSSLPTGTGPPKLKIKIGGSIPGLETISSLQQEDRSNIRPPKKRLSSIPNMPSMEELKRESMKYRRMIMADFVNNDEKTSKFRKDKRDKNGKRKKKQSNKKEGCVQILEDGPAPPKLIIRLGKNSQSSGDEAPFTSMNVSLSVPVPAIISATTTVTTTAISEHTVMSADRNEQPLIDLLPSDVPEKIVNDNLKPSEDVPQAGKQFEHSSVSALRNVRCAKVSPIRLKLMRCQEGYELQSPGRLVEQQSMLLEDSGMDQSCETKVKISEEETSSSRADEKLPLLNQSGNTQHNSPGCPPAPLPQGCQVR